MQATIKRVVPYIEMEEFHPDQVAKVSKACKSICQWVRAMYVYHNVALQVEPKRQALAAAQAELDETNRQLAAAQGELAEVQVRLCLTFDRCTLSYSCAPVSYWRMLLVCCQIRCPKVCIRCAWPFFFTNLIFKFWCPRIVKHRPHAGKDCITGGCVC